MSADARAPLSPADFQILLALADGIKHGHAIKLDVRDRTEGAVVMGPGTLYGAIKRLLARSYIREVEEPDGSSDHDERRRYYEATPAGMTAARAEASRLQVLLGIAAEKRLTEARG